MNNADIIIKQLVSDIPPGGQVIDFGVGDGKHSLPLARLGYKLTGVDISSVEIHKFEQNAELAGVNITSINTDMCEFKPQRKYDVVMSIASLNYVRKKSVSEFIRDIQNITAVGGVNIIVAYTKGNLDQNCGYLLKQSELRCLYDGWGVKHYDEATLPWEQHNSSFIHFHGIATLYAIKVN